MSQTRVASRIVGTLPDGRDVVQWTIEAPSLGIAVAVLEWGATIQSVRTPDRDGRLDEIVLGFPDLDGYLDPVYRARNPYFGSTIGRYANRIAGGAFTLDGVDHSIERNEGTSALHGGRHGFDQHLWQSTELPDGVRMSRLSPHGEQGFPGTLDVAVEFRLTDGVLHVEYQASTDRRTVINLTNHTYWNLGGPSSSSVMGHLLQVAADSYIPIDDDLVPIGTVEPVHQSPFDFRSACRVGDRVDSDHLQLVRAGGIDHTFVVRPNGHRLREAARLVEPMTGRSLIVATSEPGVQVYTGNMLDGTFVGHDAARYGRRSAIAVEPQHFPDSPNRASFPSTVLAPGSLFRSASSFEFGLVSG